jgi:methylmalonyl-CoA mutase N-terminal domain/subunit
LNIQNIIALESNVVNTADPLGGSYYLESLTNEVEKQANAYLEKIEALGGIIPAIESGWVKKETTEATMKREEEVAKKKRVVIGVNELVIPKEQEVPIPIVREPWLEDGAEDDLVAIFRKFKESRNIQDVKESLKYVQEEAKKENNLVPSTIEAVKARATMSEVIGVIREANGLSYDPFKMIKNPFWEVTND